MSARDNEAIVREAHEAFNARDLDRAVAYAAEDLEWTVVASGETFHGPEGYRRYMQNWIDAFSDAGTEITAVHAGDGFAVVEFTGRGTHDGTLKSPAGDVPATGRVSENAFCEVVQIEDGKISRARTYLDLATMMAQLGLMPAPEGAAG
ncbi:DUF4440 domain-containing protein [Rubrobacter marinus]|uniref:DUF4440 domain-containing protein n=1 Tax=Rubrobacter marinus TaxID=2653852 RepID=A0A6G8PYM3_9ACTN|nr:nuclear transport factor 2 family protein [Rubrobacter marinus]QIN79311.1 DUF4440 domain-containing protein [Rubrobacter marinus]